jgi:4-diphosphocytidyl-2-C-methyl-D-erythritol kinase
MATRLHCAAPAKINLALHVTGRRADGYHFLESLVVFTSHGDRLTAEAAERDSFRITGPFAAGLPLDEANLVLRARDLLRQAYGPAVTGPVALALEKNLPIASGIGGGSSDAAAALSLLARFWAIDADPAALARIGLQIGADVPMCLAGRPLLARGIGEALEPLPALPALPLLLVNPGVPLATPAVFSALMRRENPALPGFKGDDSLEQLVLWLRGTRNDLEAPALSLAPEIGRALGRLQAEGALVARMSGSGATCFGIFETEAQADRAAAAIAARHPGWFVRATESIAPAMETSHA